MKRVHLPLKLPGISSWELWTKLAKNVSAGMSVLFTHSRKSAVTLLVMTYSTKSSVQCYVDRAFYWNYIVGRFLCIFHLSLLTLELVSGKLMKCDKMHVKTSWIYIRSYEDIERISVIIPKCLYFVLLL